MIFPDRHLQYVQLSLCTSKFPNTLKLNSFSENEENNHVGLLKITR